MERGLKTLHESTSRLRRAAGSDTHEWYERVQNRERISQKQERGPLQKEENSQSKIFLEEKKAKARRKKDQKEEKQKAARMQLRAQRESILEGEKETAQRKIIREEQEQKAAQRQEEARRLEIRREQEEEKAAQRQEEARRLKIRREQKEKRREQRPRRGVEKLGYTKDTEYSGDLSWTDLNASGSHYPGPEFNSHGGALRYGGGDVFWTLPPPLTTTSTAQDRFKE